MGLKAAQANCKHITTTMNCPVVYHHLNLTAQAVSNISCHATIRILQVIISKVASRDQRWRLLSSALKVQIILTLFTAEPSMRNQSDNSHMKLSKLAGLGLGVTIET